MKLTPINHGTAVKDTNIPTYEISLSQLSPHKVAVVLNNKVVAYIGLDVVASDNNPEGLYKGCFIHFTENEHEILYKADSNCFQLNQ